VPSGAAGTEATTGTQPIVNTVGEPCSSDADCSAPVGLAPFCWPEPESPGGECSAAGCFGQSCGVGTVCLGSHPDSGLNQWTCQRACTKDSDCRAGYVCFVASYQPDAFCFPEQLAMEP
jgi:hypothetical protein